MPGFTSDIAAMYANARPQFQAQSPRPGVLPNTGRTNEGYGAIGQAFGKGVSDTVQKGFVDPRVNAMANKAQMDLDPAMQYQMMMKAYDLYAKMPESIREQVKSNPGHQAQLQKWITMFPGQAPIISDPSTGINSFAPPVAPVEQQKGEALQGMEGPQRNKFLLSGESESLAKGGYYGANARLVTEGELPEKIAQARFYNVKSELEPSTVSSENLYRERTGKAAEKNAQTAANEVNRKEGLVDPALARMAAEDARRTAKEASDQAKADAKEKSEKEKAEQKEMAGALTAYSSNVKQRNNALATGKMADRYQAALDNAVDLTTYLDSTAHLPRAINQQINLATGTLSELAMMYRRAIQEKKDPKVLQALKARAQDIYGRFYYGTKGQNALESPTMKKILATFEEQRTTSTLGGKNVVIPNDTGWFNEKAAQLTGRYF